MTTIRHLAAFVLCALVVSFTAHAADNLKAFPPPDEGMVRYVINLPKQRDEAAFKGELQVGKLVHTDAVNCYFFGGALETKTIDGGGFDRHVLRELGPLGGTLMAPDPKAPQIDRFVTLRGDPQLLRYNSRMPLVVYVPKDVQVRYRIWRASHLIQRAKQG